MVFSSASSSLAASATSTTDPAFRYAACRFAACARSISVSGTRLHGPAWSERESEQGPGSHLRHELRPVGQCVCVWSSRPSSSGPPLPPGPVCVWAHARLSTSGSLLPQSPPPPPPVHRISRSPRWLPASPLSLLVACSRSLAHTRSPTHTRPDTQVRAGCVGVTFSSAAAEAAAPTLGRPLAESISARAFAPDCASLCSIAVATHDQTDERGHLCEP